MDLGNRLRALRESKHLKQEDIWKEFSLASSSYSQYESNKRRPPYELLIKFADYYDVSVDYLLGRIDTYYPTVISSRKLAVYTEQELAVIYMIHEMDEANRKSVYDFTQYVYDNYKKITQSNQNVS